MAPSVDCTANLYCSEDALGCASEDEIGSFGEEDRIDDSQPAVLLVDHGDVDEPISFLVEKERWHLPQADYLQRLQNKTLDPMSRQNAIGWMFKVQARYNYGPLTSALSVNYLDRFLSRHQMPNGRAWMLQLLSVACLSLAAKMEETDVPLLLDFQDEGAEFVFEPRTIQRMELFVLSTLDWRMSSVTPFSYIDYFILKLGVREHVQRVLVSRINYFVLRSLKEVRFLEYQPSAIASAATLCAIKEMFSVHYPDCKKALFFIPSLPQESCEGCLKLMEEMFAEPLRHSPKRNHSCSTSIPQSPVGVLDASFSCDSESAMRSLESSLSVHIVSSPASKKRRVDEFCSSLHPLEAL